jgi:hypothetical protein
MYIVYILSEDWKYNINRNIRFGQKVIIFLLIVLLIKVPRTSNISVLEMKILIYWSEANFWIYFYIHVILKKKNEKFLVSECLLTI